MRGLQIPPHSRRITRFAVAGLAVLSAAAFSLGLEHQVGGARASPFLTPADAPLSVDAAAKATAPDPTPASPNTAEPPA